MKKSISRSIRNSMLLYTALIILLLWAFQIVFLNTYYQQMKKASIIRAGTQILSHVGDEDFSSYLDRMAFDNHMCILILGEDGREQYSIDMLGRSCLIHTSAIRTIEDTLLPVLAGEEQKVVEIVEDRHFKFPNQALIYAQNAAGADGGRITLILNGTISPIGATQDLLENQLGMLTAILVVVAILISGLVGRRLTRPIKRINSRAKRLAEGDYRADFEGDGIEEMEQLAGTLNFAAEGLSRVEELRRELVANVSHDLKTPLTMIKAYAELIRDVTGNDPEKRDGQLEVIISEADRQTALVGDLIRVSRDEEAEREMVPERFDLSEEITTIVERFSQLCPDYQILLEGEGPFPVEADRRSISQVLYNLVSNAINYTGEDRKVTVRVKTERERFRVEICDSGAGIPKEEQALIWERYYRSRNTHQRPVAGSGLGLSIVRGALMKQGFPYGVESEPGMGSRFWFSLPKAGQ